MASTFANLDYNPYPAVYDPHISNLIGLNSYVPKAQAPEITTIGNSQIIPSANELQINSINTIPISSVNTVPLTPVNALPLSSVNVLPLSSVNTVPLTPMNEVPLNPPQQIAVSYHPLGEVGYTSNTMSVATPAVPLIPTSNIVVDSVLPGQPTTDFVYDSNPISVPYNDINVEELIRQLLALSRAQDDRNFDPHGWRNFYDQNDQYFNFDHGMTFPDQVQVTHPENLQICEVYTGEMNPSQQRHGYGVLYNAKGVKRGDFRNGAFSGWGREALPDGEFYEGRFVNGELTGKGIHHNKTGTLYKGDFINKIKDGQGDLANDNIHYSGDFRNDKLNGKGYIEYLKEGHSYEGDFRDNQITGNGIFKWMNGDVYEGSMYNGQMDGRGKYTHNNGQVYEGEYSNGLKHGYGKMTYPNGYVYQGEFKDGLPDGKGVFSANGKKSDVEFVRGNVVKGGEL